MQKMAFFEKSQETNAVQGKNSPPPEVAEQLAKAFETVVEVGGAGEAARPDDASSVSTEMAEEATEARYSDSCSWHIFAQLNKMFQ